MKNLHTFEEFLNESLNESITGTTIISKGLFKGYSQWKDRLLIPLNIKSSDVKLDKYQMAKATVGFGFEFNKIFKFPYDCYDLMIIDDEIYMAINNNGKKRLKVNIESNNYTMDDFLSKLEISTKNYFKI